MMEFVRVGSKIHPKWTDLDWMRKELLESLDPLNLSNEDENRSGYRSMVRQTYPKIFLKN